MGCLNSKDQQVNNNSNIDMKVGITTKKDNATDVPPVESSPGPLTVEPKLNETVQSSKIENSKLSGNNQKKKVIKKKKKGNFKDDLLTIINEVRTNPASFAEKVAEAIQHIKPSEPGSKNAFVFEHEACNKATLNRGVPAFEEAIDYLRNAQSVAPLQHADELVLQIPEKSLSWTKKEIISELLGAKRKEIEGMFNSLAFHFEVESDDALVAMVLMIVDEKFNGQRRNNLMNAKFNYIGISHAKDKKKPCTYLTFA